MTMQGPTRRTALPAGAACLAAAALLTVHARHHLPFLADDALISLRYTARLLAGHGLTWTAGERVEGYSNLLWVLAAAVPGLLGAHLIAGLRAVGVLASTAAAAALIWPHRQRLAAWAPAALFFVLAGPVAVWSIGGLEAPLVAALLAWGLAAAPGTAGGRVGAGSVPLGLLVLARPDGIVLAAAVAAGAGAARYFAGRSRRAALAAVARLLAPAVALLAAQTVFRLAYYHDWLPNTAYAKLGFTWGRFAAGAAYVGQGLGDLWPLVAAGVAGLVLAARRADLRPRVWPIALTTVVWLVYLTAIGGDVFPAYRHLVPVAVTLAWGVGLGLEALPRRRGTAALLATAVAVAFGVGQWRDPEYRKADDNRFVWWGKETALTLRTAFGARDPLMAVSAAGCLPYFSGFRSLDILGLCDRHIAHARPADFGRGPLGHELGDAAYVLDREPDILIVGPPGPGAGRQLGGRYDDELLGDPRFLRDYKSVPLRVDGPDPFTCYVWLRETSERVGWRQGGSRILVPAYFCNSNPKTVARLDADGKLGITVDAATPASLLLGTAASRIGDVTLVPASPAAHARIVTQDDGKTWLDVTAAEPVTIEAIVLHLE